MIENVNMYSTAQRKREREEKVSKKKYDEKNLY